MASNRHLGRIIATANPYEEEFRVDAADADLTLAAVLARNVDRYKDMVDDVVHRAAHTRCFKLRRRA